MFSEIVVGFLCFEIHCSQMSSNKIRGSVLVNRRGGYCYLNRIRTVELDFPEDAVDRDVIVECKCWGWQSKGITPPLIFIPCSAKKNYETRMHSSRMRTARSSSRHGGGLHTPTPRADPPGAGTPRAGPPGSRPPQARPLNFPLGCGPGDPSLARPLNFPPGCGPGNLKGMLGYHPPWRPAARHAGIPPAMHAGIPPPVWTEWQRHVKI